MYRRARVLSVVATMAASAGCGGGVSTLSTTPRHLPPDTVIVALPDPVDPAHAPVPENRSERVVFAHLYSTLIDADSAGAWIPRLAESWSEMSPGCWRFRLPVSRGPNGVDVEDVARCIGERVVREAGIDSVHVEDDRHVDVALARTQPGIGLLAGPEYAITRLAEGSRWPGATSYWSVTEGDPGAGILLRAPGPPLPTLRFLPGTRTTDARNLLGGSVDVIVTDDPSVLEYARAVATMDVTPLAFDRAYVLVSPLRIGPASPLRLGAAPPRGLPGLPADMRDALARDAVSRDARGSAVGWLARADACGDVAPVPGWSRTAPQGVAARSIAGVAYDDSDPVARELAERIVALAAMDTTASADARSLLRAVPGLASRPGGLAASPLDSDALARSLFGAGHIALIIAVPCRPADACAAARALARRAPWLAGDGAAIDAAIVPLVDTRAHVIAMRNRVRLAIDAAGGFQVLGAVPVAGAIP